MRIFIFSALLLLFLIFSHCRPEEQDYFTSFPGQPDVPSSIMEEHKNLLDRAYQFTLLPDSTGIAALKLYEMMIHHFNEEEDFAFPPLGVLPMLASEEVPEKVEEIIRLTERLQSQMPVMLAEHQMAGVYLDELKQVASEEYLPQIIKFETDLHRHAAFEEEVLFPAAILVGEYLKLNLNPD
jgi:hypothetical protein